MVELRQLEVFEVLAAELHFGKAAIRLGITQPALSQQVKRLEEIAGARLFDRTNKRVELTAAGQALLEAARQLLPLSKAALDRVQQLGRGEVGTLRLGFAASGAFGLLPEIIREYRGKFPEVRLELVEGAIESPLQRLESGLVDVALLRGPVSHPALTIETLSREPLCMAFTTGHPLSRRERVPLAALANEPFVMFPRARAPEFYDAILGECRRAGFSPRVAYEASDWQVIASFVAAGLGSALAPESVRSMPRRGVVFRAVGAARPIAELAVAFRASNTSPLIGGFLAVAREVAVATSPPPRPRARPAAPRRPPARRTAPR